MTADSTTPADDKHFSLRSLFIAVAVCCVLFALVRLSILRSAGQEEWKIVCRKASAKPQDLKLLVDEFLDKRRQGRLVIPHKTFVTKELWGTNYIDNMGQLDAAVFLDCLEQFEYMKSVLALNNKGVSDARPKEQIGQLTFNVAMAACKIVGDSAEQIITAQEAGIALPDDKYAELNKLIADLALLKRKLPGLIWRVRPSYRTTTLPENPSWQQILRFRGFKEDIRPALVPVIEHDLKAILAYDQTLSSRISDSTLEAHKERLETLKWLCEFPDDEYAIPQ